MIGVARLVAHPLEQLKLRSVVGKAHGNLALAGSNTSICLART